ncbi:MAG: type 4a pilus biogenesis protein PilO [Deltaproteobacteria bacterium]|nr:type 4a pilus biogenesis protein PilO [Deltaproteobacteria bacterium]
MELNLDQFQGQLDKLNKLPRAYRMAIAPAIVILISALYVYFLYLPAKQQLTSVHDQHLQLQRKLAEVRAVASNEDAVKAEIAALERKLSVALRQLPDSKELPVLLTDITSLGKNAGLDFKGFRPQSEVHKGFYAEVPINIEFTGQFHDAAMFFDEVSRLPRIVNMGELKIVINREDTFRTVLKVSGQATTYRFVEAPPKGAEPEEAKGKGKAKGKRARKRGGKK